MSLDASSFIPVMIKPARKSASIALTLLIKRGSTRAFLDIFGVTVPSTRSDIDGNMIEKWSKILSIKTPFIGQGESFWAYNKKCHYPHGQRHFLTKLN
jgi:hypothetical protein